MSAIGRKQNTLLPWSPEAGCCVGTLCLFSAICGDFPMYTKATETTHEGRCSIVQVNSVLLGYCRLGGYQRYFALCQQIKSHSWAFPSTQYL